MKDVSVIILNYNSGDYTLNCVRSIRERTSPKIDFEIIIVDNNSRREEFEKLNPLRKTENVKIVRTEINLGFAGGNMRGFKEASPSKRVFFLNNDCELLNDNLSILTEFMEKNPNAALCAGQMRDADLNPMKSICYPPSLSLLLLGHSFFRFFKPKEYPDFRKEYDSPAKVPCLAGAALFFDREAFEKAGGFDEGYFLYCEEEDVAQAIRSIGGDIYLVPAAEYVHYLSKSTKKDFKAKREYYISLMRYFRKHSSPVSYFFLKFFYFLKLIRKYRRDKAFVDLAFFVLRGAPEEFSLRNEQKPEKTRGE